MCKMTQIEKAERDLENEYRRQLHIVYSATAIAFWREYGWRQKKILGVLGVTKLLWNKCAEEPMVTMLMMLDEATGIEIRARGVSKSYKELDYLNGTAEPRPMTGMEYLYMKIHQKDWVNPQITAALLLALHLKYGWSGERDQRLLDIKDSIEQEYGYKEKKLLDACRELTGINIVDEVKRQ